MILYVVVMGTYEEDRVVGVFDSLPKAIENRPHKGKWQKRGAVTWNGIDKLDDHWTLVRELQLNARYPKLERAKEW